MKKKIYLICNSHLDPIWLWGRSSGRSAWINTMHSVVRVMDENPDIKFTCSAASLYRYIEECDPALFNRIAGFVREKRWEIAGGWEVQSDVIIARPETLVHQALTAKKYFMDKFGVNVTTGYCVDSFGHSAGLPKILNASGFTHYVYTRSQPTPPVFNWVADDGSSVTALHIVNSYCTSGNKQFLLDLFKANLNTPMEHQAMFFGIGDHGGGISRRELSWIRELQKDHDIVFATLEEYFEAIKDVQLETVTGELGPIHRGCYANCHEVKRKISRAARKLITAEKLGVEAGELEEAWTELCFNHFHDILPGTSIKEAFEKDIFPGIGSVEHVANKLIDRQLFRHAAALDTNYMTEGGIFCWNPNPFTHKSIASFDGFGDPNYNKVLFNVLRDRDGNEFPLQILPPATGFGPCGAVWGKLTSIIELPPMEEKDLAYGVSDKKFPSVGFERSRKLLDQLSIDVCFDDSHTWGFDLRAYDVKLADMELVKVEEYTDGPVCSILRAFYRYGNSEVWMDLITYAAIPEIGVKLRLDWHEIKCAVKLAWKHGLERPLFYTGSSCATVCRMGEANYGWEAYEWKDGKLTDKAPGSSEWSMIDWCAAQSGSKIAAFFAPDLHSCDHVDHAMRLTVNHPVMYADHAPFVPNPDSGWMDLGVSERLLWIAEYDDVTLEEIAHYAKGRLNNGEIREITAHDPGLPVKDEFLHLDLPSKQLTVQELRRDENGKIELTVYNHGDEISVDIASVGNVRFPAKALTRITY